MQRRVLKLYLANSMENLVYEEVKYRNFYARTILSALGIEVFDPIIKEKHTPGRIINLKNCGIAPIKVMNMDLGAVEDANVIFWITGDKPTEGCVSEVTWAACLNKHIHKKYPKKIIVVVSTIRHKSTPKKDRRVHFTTLHPNTVVVKTIDDGIFYIKRRFKL